VAELIGGWLANSLALLADAGHMLADIMALGLALVAAWTARRPPDPSRTYGYQRVEILAALFNGVALIVIALFIFHEAWQRFAEPPEVAFGLMAAVASGGLVVNVIGARLLHRHQHGLNVRAAYLHVLGDLLGSIGTLVAAAAIGLFGWRWADPAVSVVIGGVIVFGAVRVVLDSVNVLLEGAPAHLNTEQVRDCLSGVAGVSGVHDLHLWSLGGRAPLLSAHLELDGTLPTDRVLREATMLLRERFGIDHATLQLDPPDYNVIQMLSGVGED
jgi:cobalt-zinc-cadmium efflux system protein